MVPQIAQQVIVVNGKAVMTHSFLYVDGHRVGDIGNDGNELTTSGKSYAEDLTKYTKPKKEIRAVQGLETGSVR